MGHAIQCMFIRNTFGLNFPNFDHMWAIQHLGHPAPGPSITWAIHQMDHGIQCIFVQTSVGLNNANFKQYDLMLAIQHLGHPSLGPRHTMYIHSNYTWYKPPEFWSHVGHPVWGHPASEPSGTLAIQHMDHAMRCIFIQTTVGLNNPNDHIWAI